MTEENKIRDAAEAVKGIVEAVPIYQDAVQPAARELGKGLETVAKAINVALAPVGALVWGFEKIEQFISVRVAEKLRRVPADRIATPDPTVAGPALEALRYTGHLEGLREMYANLLATTLDSATSKIAHPSFVGTIKDMTPDEAKVIRLVASGVPYPIVDARCTNKQGGFIVLLRNVSLLGTDAGCQHHHLCPSYIDNLCRLGLIEIPEGSYTADDSDYARIEKHTQLLEQKRKIEEMEDESFDIVRKCFNLTDFGRQFVEACVIEGSHGVRA